MNIKKYYKTQKMQVPNNIVNNGHNHQLITDY
jgi:hypothetical protein